MSWSRILLAGAVLAAGGPIGGAGASEPARGAEAGVMQANGDVTVESRGTGSLVRPAGGSLEQALARALKVSSVQVVQLDFDRRPGQPLAITLPIEGVEHEVRMDPVSVRSPRFEVLVHMEDGSYRRAPDGVPCTLLGGVPGVEGSTAAGGVLEDGLYATVQFPDGVHWWVQPAVAVASDEMIAAGLVPDGLHVLYRGDSSLVGHRCMTNEPPVVVGGASGPVIVDRGGTKRVSDLAVDCEFAFYQKTGSILRTAAMVELLINIVNVQFERDVDIRHQITTIIVRTTAVYIIADGFNLLDQFQNRWNANHADIQRDHALFFNGNGDGGQSRNGQVCNISTAYSGVGVDQLTLHTRTDTIAHELGHIWNAAHCTCASPAFTMHDTITGANRFVGSPTSHAGQPTVTEIVNFRNSRNCLSTSSGSALPNDFCSQAIDLPCAFMDDMFADCAFGFSNIGATQDGPSDGCRQGTADIWYRFVPRCSGQIRIHTCIHTTFDTVLMAYEGGCPSSSANLVACNDDNPGCAAGNLRSEIIFNGQAGVPYFIRVAGYNGATGHGILEFRYTNCPRPSNDSCNAATTVSAGDSIPFSTIGALTGTWVQPTSIQRDSFLESCGSFDDMQLVNDVWFRYVPTCSGNTLFSLCGASFNTKMALYGASCPTGDNQALTCNDNSGPGCSGNASSFNYSVTAGLVYRIRIGGYAGQMGTGFLNITPANCPPPGNNNCPSAAALAAAGSPTTIQAPMANAGRDGGATCTGANLADTWYTLTAPCDGTLRLSTCGTFAATGRRTSLSVHSACPGTSANELACNSGDPACGGGNDATIALAVVRGQTVWVRIAAHTAFMAGTTASLTHWLQASASGNDSCAAPATADQTVRDFCTVGATASPEVLGCATVGPDVWFRYVATCTAPVRVSVCGTNFVPVVGVFTGCAGSSIVCVNGDGAPVCGTIFSQVAFNAVNGTAYLIRVSSAGGVVGSGTISVSGCASATSGACCTIDGVCQVRTSIQCLQVAGRYFGNGTACPGSPGGIPSCCPADINGDGRLSVQDIFDFLELFFAGDPRADINRSRDVTVQDIFDFLELYFRGC